MAGAITDHSDVWVFAEQNNGRIQSVTYEMLGEGRKLADSLGMNLCAVLFGAGIGDKTQDLITRGAQKVYVVDKQELADYHDEPYAATLVDLVKKHKPYILLCGATTVGRSLAARAAALLGTGLVSDCVGLVIDPQTKNLLQTRPVLAGSMLSTSITPNARPQMVTVRRKVMKEAVVDSGLKGEVLLQEVAAGILATRARRLKVEVEAESTINISDADIIVSGGRGMQSAEGFAVLKELASVLGAGLGASRAAVDASWIGYSHQVGQTGKTVCPKIYFACGISGQIQHLAGISASDIIVAINKDPEAPIFKLATYGIVGDLFKVIPVLTAAFSKLLQK